MLQPDSCYTRIHRHFDCQLVDRHFSNHFGEAVHAKTVYENNYNKITNENEIDIPFFDDGNGIFLLNIDTLANFAEYAKNYSCSKDKFLNLIILLPKENFCCNKLIKLDCRYASAVLYCVSIVKTAKSYHGKCKSCHTTYYYSYSESKTDNTRKFIVDQDDEYLLFSSGVGYSKKFLYNIDMQISIGVVSFQASAEIYNNTVDSQYPLNHERLEEGYFVFKILSYVRIFRPWPRDKNSRLNVEILCEQVYQKIRMLIDEKWMQHMCSEEGCTNRFIVIDGNETNYRTMCMADKTRIIGSPGNVNRYEVCIRNPIRGNQHYAPSKYCPEHTAGPAPPNQSLDMRPRTRSFFKSIPRTITLGEGCKKDEAVDRFYHRTAGMFYVYRSCGIRITHWEMITAESLSDVFTWLVDLFSQDPSEKDIKGIVYDRACDLKPFIQRLSKEENQVATK